MATSLTLRFARFSRMTLVLLLSRFFQVYAKEIIATYEWQQVGPNDTLPAGLEIRMDLTTGEKWARLPPEEEDEVAAQGDQNHPQEKPHHIQRCGPSCKERQAKRRSNLRGRNGNALNSQLAAVDTDTKQHRSMSTNFNGSYRTLILKVCLSVIMTVILLIPLSGRIKKAWRSGIHDL